MNKNVSRKGNKTGEWAQVAETFLLAHHSVSHYFMVHDRSFQSLNSSVDTEGCILNLEMLEKKHQFQ